MTEPEPPRRWLDRGEAAAYLSCGSTTIDRLVESGHLTRYKVGALARYDVHQIDAMLLASAQPAAERNTP